MAITKTTLAREVLDGIDYLYPKTISELVTYGDTSTVYDEITDIKENKVDKEYGKELSTNDFTDDEKEKLRLIENKATRNIIDYALDSTSANALENRIITQNIDSIIDLIGEKATINNIFDNPYDSSNLSICIVTLKRLINELDQNLRGEINNLSNSTDSSFENYLETLNTELSNLRNEILGIVDGESLDEALDTIKELQNWIKSDTTGGKYLIDEVASLKSIIGGPSSGLIKKTNDLESSKANQSDLNTVSGRVGTSGDIANKSGTTAWSRIKAIENFVNISDDENLSAVVARHDTQLGGLYFVKVNDSRWGYKTSPTGTVIPFSNPSGTANKAQVLSGYTFASANTNGQDVAGTMTNYGSKTLKPGGSSGTGYYSGVSVVDIASIQKTPERCIYVNTNGGTSEDSWSTASFNVVNGETYLVYMINKYTPPDDYSSLSTFGSVGGSGTSASEYDTNGLLMNGYEANAIIIRAKSTGTCTINVGGKYKMFVYKISS